MPKQLQKLFCHLLPKLEKANQVDLPILVAISTLFLKSFRDSCANKSFILGACAYGLGYWLTFPWKSRSVHFLFSVLQKDDAEWETVGRSGKQEKGKKVSDFRGSPGPERHKRSNDDSRKEPPPRRNLFRYMKLLGDPISVVPFPPVPTNTVHALHCAAAVVQSPRIPRR